MKKFIALAVALAIASPAIAADTKTNTQSSSTPAATTQLPAAKPGDNKAAQPAGTKDSVKVDAQKDAKKQGTTPAAGATQPSNGQKTSEKPGDTKKQ